MKRLIMTVIIVLLVLTSAEITPVPVKDYSFLYKGIVYTLLKDKDLAYKNYRLFFRQYPDPALQSAFETVVKGKGDEGVKQFKTYLDINLRSLPALVGIAMAATDMPNSGSILNLERAQRMDETFAAVYPCLGYEYMKRKNYPKAEYYFNQAMRYSKIPENKILLANLYLEKNDPGKVLSLLRGEADAQPDNFYCNFYTAKALFSQGDLQNMRRYLAVAIKLGEEKKEVKLLLARFFLGIGENKDALGVLKEIDYSKNNDEYIRLYARVLFELRDPKTKSYLEKAFIRDKWNKEINTLMGRFYEQKKQEKGNVQNWINRSLLCGSTSEELKKIFPESYEFPEYRSIPFFDVEYIRWITNDLVAVGAIRSSGEPGKLFLIDTVNLKTIGSVDYLGKLTKIFVSPDRTKMIFYTSILDEDSIYLYSVELIGQGIRSRMLTKSIIPLKSVLAGFTRSGDRVYLTDGALAAEGFVSPFASVDEVGNKKPVYSNYPYPLLVYYFNTQKFEVIRDMNWLPKIPISYVKKYYRVSEASASKSDIQALIEKGQKLDLTSSELVKIYFARDMASFLIYLSDLKNPFQAIVYDFHKNNIKKFDESMFIEKGKFSNLKLLYISPNRQELFVSTKDDSRWLIRFNYKNFLSTFMTNKVMETFYDPSQYRILALTERSKKPNYTETNLEIIYLYPYYKKIIDTRRDLKKILFTKGGTDVYFSTLTGEWVKLDMNNNFTYLGPSFEDSIYAISPSRKQTAAFINNRLVILDGPANEFTLTRKTKPAPAPAIKKGKK